MGLPAAKVLLVRGYGAMGLWHYGAMVLWRYGVNFNVCLIIYKEGSCGGEVGKVHVYPMCT